LIVGGHSSTGYGLAQYLTEEKNERAEVWSIRGCAFPDLAEAVQDWRIDGLGTKAEKPVYHAWLRPSDTDRALSREEWETAISHFEKEMGFEGQPCAVIYHHGEGQGEQGHIHLVYSRIKDGHAIPDSWNYVHHQKAKAEIEKTLGLEHVYSPHLDDEPRRAQGFDRDEKEQGKRQKRDPAEIKAEVTALRQSSDSGPAFVAALEDAGYTLFHGNRNNRHCYAILDQDGHPHSLAKYAGVRVAELRALLKDFPLESLPLEAEARALMQARQQEPERGAFAPEKWPHMVKGLGNDSPMPEPPEPQPERKNGLRFLAEPEPDRKAPEKTPEIARPPEPERQAPESAPKIDPEAAKARASELAAAIRAHSGKGPSARAVEKTLQHRAKEGRELDAEQTAAVRHATENGFSVIQGRAGTGKSFTLNAIREAYERGGFEVIGLTPTHTAAHDLREAGFTEARTLHSFLYAEQKRIEQGRPAPESGSRVLIVDEAGMVSNRHLTAIMETAAAQGARVILAGDDRQLKSIEQGGLFGALATDHAAELTTVYRQRDDWQKAATRAFAQGDTAAGLEAYHERGFIHYADGDRSHAAAELVKQWVADRDEGRTGNRFVFSVTNKDTHEVNAMIQAEQIKAGLVTNAHVYTVQTKTGIVKDAQTRTVTEEREIRIGEGDRVQFRGNDKANGIFNGTLATVERIDPEAPHFLNVRLDNGTQKTIDTTAYKDIQLGYAGTVYRGQGKTLDRSYVLFSPYMDGRGAYVAATRAREETHIYAATGDLEARHYRRHIRTEGLEMPETNFEKLVAIIEGRTIYNEQRPQAPAREIERPPEPERQAPEIEAPAVIVAPEVAEAREAALAARVAAWEERADRPAPETDALTGVKAEGMSVAGAADKMASGVVEVLGKGLDAAASMFESLFEGPKPPPTPEQIAQQEAKADDRAARIAAAAERLRRVNEEYQKQQQQEQEQGLDRGRSLDLFRK
jgi:hypothetical protein